MTNPEVTISLTAPAGVQKYTHVIRGASPDKPSSDSILVREVQEGTGGAGRYRTTRTLCRKSQALRHNRSVNLASGRSSGG